VRADEMLPHEEPRTARPIADSSYTSVQFAFSEPLIEIHPMFTDFQSQG
jgi:hypothetical protein